MTCSLCGTYAGSTIVYRAWDDVICTSCARSATIGTCKRCSRPVTLHQSGEADWPLHVKCAAA